MKTKTTLKFLMKKNPYLYKHFLKIRTNKINKNIDESIIISLYLKIKKHHNLIKFKKINILEIDSFERMDDCISYFIRLSDINKFISNFLTKKYKKLIFSESYDYFAQLYDLDIDKNVLEKYFRKIARIKDSQSLSLFLKNIIESNSSSDINSIISLIKENNLNVDIISIDHSSKELILKIKDYKASRLLGSTSWCISYDKKWFNKYTGEKGKFGLFPSQYFILNFSYPANHRLSKVGVTVGKDTFIFSADNFDRSLHKNYSLCKRIQKIHNEIINDEYLLNFFTSNIYNFNMDSIQDIIERTKNIKFKKVSVEGIVLFSSRLDVFTTKSTKKRSQTLFYKAIISKYSATDDIPDEISDLIFNKYPKLSRLLNSKNYKIKSAIY
jgi:hypothetical protein